MENTPDDVFTLPRNVANRRPSSSRTQFHSNNHSLSARQGRLRSDLTKIPSSMSPPVRRGSPLNPQKAHHAVDLGRRRSSQADMPVASTESSLHHRTRLSTGLGDTMQDLDLSADEELQAEVGIFSNEYDLSHEDPRILQDVQRALKMKARREARLKQKNVVGPNFTESTGQPSTPPSNPSPFSPKLPSSPSSLPSSRKLSSSGISDLDFSPSTATPEFFVQPSHPIPSSLDNGKTLDWSGVLTDDADKRWSISIGKKKERDKLPPLGAMIDQQHQLYNEKLSRINSRASSQTILKASITGEQLRRRYKLVYEPLASKKVPLNLVQIARWFETQDEPVRKSLEKAEPFTWLKHLDKGTSKSSRSSRHLSALIMEDYFHAQNLWDRMQTISEDSPVLGSVGPILLSPVSSRFKEKVIIERPETSDDSSSSNDSVSSDNGPSQLLPSVPDVLLQPPSSDDVAARRSAIPFSSGRTSSTGSSESGNPPVAQVENQSLLSSKSSKPRGIRTSLHARNPGRRDSPRQDSEESLRLEYEAKATLLQESIAHNHRIRQLLNRVSAAIKEYDAIQNLAFHILDIDQPSMPRDVLEAFGHDPSAVTGSTRRLRGWRAVEDINQRLTRQRNVLKTFLRPLAENVSARGCLLDESIENMLQALDYLEGCRDAIIPRVVSILNLLNSVQGVHADVKENYKLTISRASVVYPELSHIVALEESYKDQYQHFWGIGLDTLTFLLDTVTPFWRTYGKTIGEDVRDFLIIPLYRNEFTGESKGYPIKGFPRRSFRHWLGLVVFFFLSIGINILQVRAAISSSLNFRLGLIPYDGIRWTALPFFWIGILIQWLAVIFEFAIVFMQAGVIIWWTGWTVKILS